jgi:hypothetical protein
MKDPIALRALQLAQDRFQWNQVEFGRQLGVEKNNVTNWLARGMPAAVQIKAAKVLGITVEELQTGKAPAPPSDRLASSRIAEDRMPYHGHLLSESEARFAAEWGRLRSPLKAQIEALVGTLVAEQVREDRAAKDTGKGPKSGPKTSITPSRARQ